MSRFHLLTSIVGSRNENNAARVDRHAAAMSARFDASTDVTQSSATDSAWSRVKQYLVYPRSLITGAVIIAIACVASIARMDTISFASNASVAAPSATSAKAHDELARFAWATGEHHSSSSVHIVLGTKAVRVEQTAPSTAPSSAAELAQISYANLFYLLLVGSFAATVLSQNKERHWRGKTAML
jgi:hypothetical protein